MGMLTQIILGPYKSSELNATILAPIWSNPEQALKQPVNRSSAGSPCDVVAPAFGAHMVARDPRHSKAFLGEERAFIDQWASSLSFSYLT
jgi:hypothetical protein